MFAWGYTCVVMSFIGSEWFLRVLSCCLALVGEERQEASSFRQLFPTDAPCTGVSVVAEIMGNRSTYPAEHHSVSHGEVVFGRRDIQ